MGKIDSVIPRLRPERPSQRRWRLILRGRFAPSNSNAAVERVKTDLVKQERNASTDKNYRETLGDAQFAIVVLAVASCSLIIFTLAVTLWVT
ncbi:MULTISPECIES: hypothetical protein [Serratia]|uniref:hypothetical protein n=1 Tax=Serratia TaxID=613 RepID=UPI0023B1CFF7|nr:hypothetical protein [Serratia marcescens]WEE03027.1 hypothetical protein PXW05_14130 [Serratia marcescens]HCD1616643.1 hypothetical protein [Serratia marcescens]HCD1617076.1 hypothetical protein [Serratia marcescens]